MKGRKAFLWMSIIVLSLFLAACGNNNDSHADVANNAGSNDNDLEENANAANNNENNNDSNVSNDDGDREPVTILWQNDWVWPYELFGAPAEEKFPHIEFEIVEEWDLETLIASQNIPDIFYGSNRVVEMKESQLDYDLDDLFEQHNYDLSRIDEGLLEEVRRDQGGIYYLPLSRAITNIYYNKSIFDEFGVSYPEDNMSWNEIIDLAADVTGERGGVNYSGLDLTIPDIMLTQRQTTHINPETHEVQYMDEPDYTEYLNMLERLWSIPGIFPDAPEEYLYSWGENFFTHQNAAMSVYWDSLGWGAEVTREQGLDWDIVTLPTWEDAPNVGNWAAGFGISVTPQAIEEKGDTIMELLEFWLSDEHQEWLSRTDARPTVLADADIQASLGAEVEGLEDVNVEAAFALEPNPGLPEDQVSPYAEMNALIDEENIVDFARMEKDVNTYLREATEMQEELIRSGIGSGDYEALGVWAE